MRIDQLDLLGQIGGGASGYLVGFGGSVVRWAALDDVRDEEIAPLDSGPFEHMIEVAAGGANKRMAGFIFIFARGFADDHKLRSRIAFTGNRNRSRLAQWTLPAHPNLRRKLRKPPLYVFRWFLRR